MIHSPARSLLVALFVLSLAPAAAHAGDLGPLEPLADLHRAVHESLGLPEPLIVQLLEAGTPDDQLPVVGFLARELGRVPEEIARLHREGLSFLDITLRFGKGPELFYVPFERDPGPPYGKAWGYYRNKPRSEWNQIRLRDSEVVDLVNLRLARDYYGVSADQVVRLRGAGEDFGAIHRELCEKTGKGHAKPLAASGKPGEGPEKKGHGRGKGKGKDKDR